MAIAKDQREQVALCVGQRRKRVHYLLDVGAQLVFVVTARGTASAALAQPSRGVPDLTGAFRSGEALTSVWNSRPETGRHNRGGVLRHGRPSPTATGGTNHQAAVAADAARAYRGWWRWGDGDSPKRTVIFRDST